MLVLSRREGQIIDLDNGNIEITVLDIDIKRRQVKIGINAPDEVLILRRELSEKANRK